jgi:hypothetical protein
MDYRPMTAPRVRAELLLAWLLVACIGCGSREPGQRTCYPVHGQLFVNQQPAAGALVILQPKENAAEGDWPSGFPHASVGADGKFEVGTYGEKDGAPAGDYVVLVRWYETPADPSAETTPADRLKGAYADPQKSQLAARVNAAATELPPIRLP